MNRSDPTARPHAAPRSTSTPGQPLIGDAERRAFAERGLVRLEQAMPREPLQALRESAYRALEDAGRWRDDAWQGGPCPQFAPDLTRRVRKRVKGASELAALVTPALEDAIATLLSGRPAQRTNPRALLLFSPPNPPPWTVPAKVWHTDVPRDGRAKAPGVQVFGFVDRVPPRGGGTLFAAGSHRLLLHDGFIRSADIKKRLAARPFFRELFATDTRDRFLEQDVEVDGVPIRVVELHGDPGDVYLTDMRLLHTVSFNVSGRPRLMVTQHFIEVGFVGHAGGHDTEA